MKKQSDTPIIFMLVAVAGFLLLTQSNGLQSVIGGTAGNYDWCYQETANVSTDCGALNTGSYNLYSTDSSNYPSFFMNYSKPDSSAADSLWMVKLGDQGLQNLSIPGVCWDQEPLQFMINSYFYNGRVKAYCHNNTGWQKLVDYEGPGCPGYNTFIDANRLIDGDWGTWAKGNIVSGKTAWTNAYAGGGCANASVYEEAMWWALTSNEEVPDPRNSTIRNEDLNIPMLPDPTLLEPAQISQYVFEIDVADLKEGDPAHIFLQVTAFDEFEQNPVTKQYLFNFVKEE